MARDAIRVGCSSGCRVRVRAPSSPVSVCDVAVFTEELQSCRLVLKVNGPSAIGRQATSEDTVRRLGKCYSEHS
jgi:hypothetical protein